MKGGGYREAVRWIAHNGTGGGGDPAEWVAAHISPCLAADRFGAAPERVAGDSIGERCKAGLPVLEAET